ncbi:unnamed protein product [Clavelina lepadiformis]|uniref:Uncharacterized protein n=1 Tax=Clavelina lepadiformis TaxID=159417 RepID=A0ABP0G711_CLALP
MKCNGAEVGTMNYEEITSKAEEVACCSLRCNKAEQQLIQRTQALVETNGSYVKALVNFGAIAYPKPEDEGTKNDVLYNTLCINYRHITFGFPRMFRLRFKRLPFKCSISLAKRNRYHDGRRKLEEVDESPTEDDVSSLIEQLHLNDLKLSDVEREAVVEVIRRRLDDVLFRLIAGGIKFKPSKCNLFKEVRYLGHVVAKSGVPCNPEKIFPERTIDFAEAHVAQFVTHTSKYAAGLPEMPESLPAQPIDVAQTSSPEDANSSFTIISPVELLSMPKADHTRQKRKSKTGETAILTSSPYKKQLAARNRSQTAVSGNSSKTSSSKKRSMKKAKVSRSSMQQKDTVHESDNNVDAECFYCNEMYSKSSENDGWIQCSKCMRWV